MATNVKSIIPAVATHPGSVLKKELKARGIKQKDFAGTIGVPAPNLNELIKGKRNITEAIAIKLEEALGIPYQSWMNLQNRYHYVVKCREEIVSGKNVIPSSGTSVFITCMKADFIVPASRLILIPMKSMSNVGRGTNSSQANKRDPPFRMKWSLWRLLERR